MYKDGHYYSPVVCINEVKKRELEIWKSAEIDGLKGIKLNTEDQIQLLKKLEEYYHEMPFKEEKQNGIRYYFKNIWYSYTDGILLYSMIRHYKPKNIIEIGSGYSSAIMLDVNELFLDYGINLTFIEPYTKRLSSLISTQDKKTAKIIPKAIQDVDLSIFKILEKGDILFIDSTHVVKTGSDVHHILFEILPLIKRGVFVHFHDIFYPFEYPKKWIFEGRSWNENYFLRAFLTNNKQFKIKLFSHYLHKHHQIIFNKMPLCYKNPGGSLWLQKT